MTYETELYILIFVASLAVLAGILGMVLGSHTSMRKAHLKHIEIMRQKHCSCYCHDCGKHVDNSI